MLSNLQPCGLELVTFGDGVRSMVIGSGLLKDPSMPELENVLLVDGLKVNLISISQLCDQNLFVKFTKNKYSVLDNTNSCVMEDRISLDNCYLLTFLGLSLTTSVTSSDIRHKRLGHISLKSLNKTLAAEAVLGIPKLKVNTEKVCGPYQMGKQIQKSHKMKQHPSTIRVLGLLHMDLMGPMQVESIGGKRYAFVCVDDFSRFS